MFWSDVDVRKPRIMRADLNGRQIETLYRLAENRRVTRLQIDTKSERFGDQALDIILFSSLILAVTRTILYRGAVIRILAQQLGCLNTNLLFFIFELLLKHIISVMLRL